MTQGPKPAGFRILGEKTVPLQGYVKDNSAETVDLFHSRKLPCPQFPLPGVFPTSCPDTLTGDPNGDGLIFFRVHLLQNIPG